MIERKQTPNGDTLLYQGKYLYSSIYPIKQAIKALHCTPKRRCLYVIVSPLLGYGLETFLEYLAPDSLVLLVEFEPILGKFTQNHCTIQHSAVRYLFHPDIYEVERYLREREFFAIEEVELLYPSAGFRFCEELYQGFFTQLMAVVDKEIANRYMLRMMRRRWLKNTICNISQPFSTYQCLPRIDRPVIVIGAGLTLEEYEEWVKDVADYYYLIVVDTALPIIQQYGLKPDLILALESSAINLLDFVGVHYPDTVMLCDLSAHPQSTRAHDGMTIYIQSVVSQAVYRWSYHHGLWYSEGEH